jgi:HD-GYP domain-containing protein (c-di-GMP phosphodiesterase class II)
MKKGTDFKQIDISKLDPRAIEILKKYPNGFPTITEEEQNKGMQVLAMKMGLKNPERFTSENAIAFWAKSQY